MDLTPQWVGLDEACEQTGISATTLRKLAKTGDLPAGQAWVYLTGQMNAPIGWNVPAIKQWQIDRTKQIAADIKTKAEAIESFS